MPHVLVTAAAVGAALAVAYAIVHMALMWVAPTWSMGHTGMVAGVFIAGAASFLAARHFGGADRLCSMVFDDAPGASGGSAIADATVPA